MPKPVCGDGKCTPPENPKSCPKDCDGPPPPWFCGDGKCTPPENKNNCPKDCGKAPSPIDCVKDKCSKQVKTCVADKDCEKIMDCAAKCEGIQCMISCWQKGGGKGQNLFMPVAQCAQQKNCLSGGPPQPICGNGQCEPGESSMSCPKDCGGTSDLLTCTKKNCPKQYEQCVNDKACNNAINCMKSCSSDACYEKCASQSGGTKVFQQFAQCAISSGCVPGGPPKPVCGNGQCEPGESPNNCPKDCGGSNKGSCKGQCGKYQQNSPCQCDQQCVEFGDCCKDYKEYCSGPNPGPVCGNGICQPPVETSQSCPQDCGSSKKPCKSKKDCKDTEICCGQPDGQYCVAIGKCG